MTKKRDLERMLRELGWKKDHGGDHDKFRKGSYSIAVPRHREIGDDMAKAILRQAKRH